MLAACSFLVDTSGLHDGVDPGFLPDANSEAAAGDAGPAVTSDGATVDGSDAGDGAPDAGAPCPSGRGPSMVRITASVGTFCIDTTEVTNTHWAAFLADKGNDTSGQPAFCSWNTTYVPTSSSNPSATVWPAPSAKAPHPVVYVDWCDALAYCAWAGKRLCGRIGGGAAPFADTGSTSNQWVNACTRGGARAFPYGTTYQPAVCNDKPRGLGATVAAGAIAECTGGYDGIFDMSGNVEEWEDSCNGTSGAADVCHRRGGSFDDGITGNGYRCDTPFNPEQVRSRTDVDVGVRCCAD
jgi:sulfatase modifying factor 1